VRTQSAGQTRAWEAGGGREGHRGQSHDGEPWSTSKTQSFSRTGHEGPRYSADAAPRAIGWPRRALDRHYISPGRDMSGAAPFVIVNPLAVPIYVTRWLAVNESKPSRDEPNIRPVGTSCVTSSANSRRVETRGLTLTFGLSACPTVLCALASGQVPRGRPTVRVKGSTRPSAVRLKPSFLAQIADYGRRKGLLPFQRKKVCHVRSDASVSARSGASAR
jgi:hypothetical protein